MSPLTAVTSMRMSFRMIFNSEAILLLFCVTHELCVWLSVYSIGQKWAAVVTQETLVLTMVYCVLSPSVVILSVVSWQGRSGEEDTNTWQKEGWSNRTGRHETRTAKRPTVASDMPFCSQRHILVLRSICVDFHPQIEGSSLLWVTHILREGSSSRWRWSSSSSSSPRRETALHTCNCCSIVY